MEKMRNYFSGIIIPLVAIIVPIIMANVGGSETVKRIVAILLFGVLLGLCHPILNCCCVVKKGIKIPALISICVQILLSLVIVAIGLIIKKTSVTIIVLVLVFNYIIGEAVYAFTQKERHAKN